jgi:hypothetical protein
MAELNSFKECREYLDKGKNRKNTMDRPIANNTRVIQISDSTIGIKLHNTFIVKYHSNDHLDCIDYGDLIEFNTNGWLTVTTKERMNRFAPISIWSERYVWYISDSNWYGNPDRKIYHYQDRIFYRPNDKTFHIKEDGQLVQLKPYLKEAEKAKRKQLRRIDNYIKAYLNELVNYKLSISAGDCFMCQGESNPEVAEKMFIGELKDGQLETKQGINPDHLESHMDEKYYVPSLIMSAIRQQCYDSDSQFGNPNMTYGLAEIDKHNISCWLHYDNSNGEHKPFASDMTRERLQKIMKKYFINRLGI